MPIEPGGSIVGGGELSGTLRGIRDDECARIGNKNIADLLDFELSIYYHYRAKQK